MHTIDAMTHIYIVIAKGAWTVKVRGVFTDQQTAIRYAIADERGSDGYHRWQVWKAQTDVPNPHPEGQMSVHSGKLHHADFDPPGELVYDVPRPSRAEIEARSRYTDMERTI